MPELMTIGYAGTSQQAVFRTLLYHDIAALLDIRETPLSRKPGMSRKGLTAACEQYGLKYEHMRDLGTPRDIRYQRKADNDFDAFRVAYTAHLATQDEAMRRLVGRALTELCCLLCYEAPASDCHRLFVAERAVEMSGGALTIVHLDVMLE